MTDLHLLLLTRATESLAAAKALHEALPTTHTLMLVEGAMRWLETVEFVLEQG